MDRQQQAEDEHCASTEVVIVNAVVDGMRADMEQLAKERANILDTGRSKTEA